MQSILCSLTRIYFLTIEDQQSNYEISILIEELKHEEVQVRLNAMRRIKDIAQALGPQRTRDDLLPYLKSCTDDEDEVLYVMAEQLGTSLLPLLSCRILLASGWWT